MRLGGARNRRQYLTADSSNAAVQVKSSIARSPLGACHVAPPSGHRVVAVVAQYISRPRSPPAAVTRFCSGCRVQPRNVCLCFSVLVADHRTRRSLVPPVLQVHNLGTRSGRRAANQYGRLVHRTARPSNRTAWPAKISTCHALRSADPAGGACRG